MYKIFSKETQEVAQVIGEFYLEKNNRDYEATQKEIESLRITDIEVDRKEIIIELSRPGLLIGKKGENCEKLAKRLFPKKLVIEEAKQNIMDYLVPEPPMPWEYDHVDYDERDFETMDDKYIGIMSPIQRGDDD